MHRKTGIYAITNLHNGHIYVGSALDIDARWKRHVRLLNRGKHHSIRLQNAWVKYGAEAFALSILELSSVEDLLSREQHWMDKLCSAGLKGYNVLASSKNSLGLRHRPESLEKISKAHKGKVISQAQRELISARLKGRTLSEKEIESRKASWTEERRTRRSEISAAIVLSEDSRMKISKALKGREFSPDWRAKISAANKGRIPSEEVRMKMSIAAKSRKPISEETRRKRAESMASYWKRKKENQLSQQK